MVRTTAAHHDLWNVGQIFVLCVIYDAVEVVQFSECQKASSVRPSDFYFTSNHSYQLDNNIRKYFFKDDSQVIDGYAFIPHFPIHLRS